MDDMTSLLQTRRNALLAVGAVLAVLLLGGQLLTRGRAASAPAPAARSAPPPVAAPAAKPVVVVDVAGAVRRPGLYRLDEGARVADAVARAGGTTRKAELDGVNLAAKVADGEQVVVPQRGAGVSAAAAGGGAATVPTGPVHLNSATAEQLDTLPGVGPVTAQKIVAYRQEHGGFRSVDELDAISGIGPAKIEQLRGLVAP
jgi:competence protein ComEA